MSKQTFREIIDAALKNPDADYKIRAPVHAVPFRENEKPRAIQSVAEKKQATDNHVIIGFGGLFTFDLAAVAEPPPAGILLCDINSTQGIFWEAFLELVKECETAEKLCERFSALPDTRYADIKFRNPQLVEMSREGKHHENGEANIEWIYDKIKYEKIRKMVRDGKVANITLDCIDDKRYEAIKRLFEKKENNFSVSTIYLSNILKFYQKEDGLDFYKRPIVESNPAIIKKFWKNQLSLCNDETVVLNTEAISPARDAIQVYTPKKITGRFSGTEQMI